MADFETLVIGADTITLAPCPAGGQGGAGVGAVRSSFTVHVNGIHRGFLVFPAGWGGAWTVHGLHGFDHNRCPDYRRSHVTASEKGAAGKRQALERMLAVLHETFPVEIEAQMRGEAARDRRRREDFRPTSYAPDEPSRYVQNRDRETRDGAKRIAAREAAEEHAEVMDSIPAAGLSNRQAAALDDARAVARSAVAAIHDVAGEARRRREIAARWENRLRNHPEERPDWWPLD